MRAALVLLLTLAACRKSDPAPLRVASASDLTEAFTELGATFEKETQTKVVFSFGSSGLLAKQLSEGAPFDLFASANEQFVRDTVKAGACDGASMKRYARGRLAALGAVASLEDLATEKVRRIALANPEHAPYGRAAREALQKLGLWERLNPKLVYAENVRQAVQLADTGNAEVALVAFSNVVDRDGGVLLVDEALYAPIEQSLAICQRGSNGHAARKFVEFLDRPESRAVMQRHGFR